MLNVLYAPVLVAMSAVLELGWVSHFLPLQTVRGCKAVLECSYSSYSG